jgi:hypothetical protein
MGDGIGSARVFSCTLDAFGLRWIMVRNVMNFVALVEPLDDLERSDLASASGWMEKIRFHPQ